MNGREEALKYVRQDGLRLKDLPPEFRADRTIVLEAVRQVGWALEFADAELRGDRAVVLESVRNFGGALRWAAEDTVCQRPTSGTRPSRTSFRGLRLAETSEPGVLQLGRGPPRAGPPS
mmetsp:Transcript_59439/g.192195  ORF Transcript_59439/g.192195 Transcript_59439/m.192195 type:complete len:119 (-) Transcript_59439:527-883(-)